MEKPQGDKEWLQNYRKEQEDNKDLKRELNQCLYNAVPVRESHPSVFSDLFILLSNTILKVILFEMNRAQ